MSCDSLRADRFASITGRDMLAQVLAGIDAAVQGGLAPVKVNAVLVRGVNDDEVVDLASLRARAGRRGALHRVHAAGRRRAVVDLTVSCRRARSSERIDGVYPLVPAMKLTRPRGPGHGRLATTDLQSNEGSRRPGRGAEPADRYRYLDGAGDVGVVASVTRPFCSNCDRVRLTAEGSLTQLLVRCPRA